MSLAKKISVTDSTGNTASITKLYSRQQVLLKNINSGSDVFLGFDSEAVYDLGYFMSPGEAVVLDGTFAISDIYFVCDSGETSTIYAQLST